MVLHSFKCFINCNLLFTNHFLPSVFRQTGKGLKGQYQVRFINPETRVSQLPRLQANSYFFRSLKTHLRLGGQRFVQSFDFFKILIAYKHVYVVVFSGRSAGFAAAADSFDSVIFKRGLQPFKFRHGHRFKKTKFTFRRGNFFRIVFFSFLFTAQI